ncbi:hypothetical protein CAPTEDRAFT_179200 [Capitella teleta]|uniref:PH domain-containing protein n=1 Tax=Capitella teleta TaxID=283909 RepID=R7TZ29_CAPTE|nr:hypothetical protein CAPTEDRAFT_179200 [Capitella teleta]|eukprot:ELT99009.1 hypothetical protein CAPTEDRAFT_179200 [Capitella teleta]
MSDSKHGQSDQYKGWVYKWTNYIKGYQKRWFVLQNGLLSYYRNQAEMSHTCRGTINLANAFIHTEDSCSFVISNGGTQTFHLKASSEVERQRWVTALELAKNKAINLLESDDEDEETHTQPDKNELQNTIRTLSAKLEDLSTCNDLITKHGAALQKALGELEQIEAASEASAKFKSVNERATLFRITSNAMINACHDYLELAQTQGKRWQKLLQSEHEQKLRLEEMVEQLAKQHQSIEKQARKSLAHANHSSSGNTQGAEGSEDEEDDFFDAVDDHTEEFKVCLPPQTHKRTGSGISVDSIGETLGPTADNYDSSDTDSESRGAEAKVISHKHGHKRTHSRDQMLKEGGSSSMPSTPNSLTKVAHPGSKRQRRMLIPERPNYSINLWSIMKNCIGKELSKIPMPVNFSEPLSFLQRITEDFEYSECLMKAAQCTDSCEQLAYIAAFTISSYANTTARTGKPFNPLLGETFECDRRDDMGWRSFAEQVSHHPPILAMHTESKDRDWSSWQEFTMSSKFRGKYLQIIPLGIAHLLFPKTGNHYTWRKVTTTVHNIIVGKLWVDNHGEMDITNHHNGDNCHLKYSAYSYFARETPRKVTGVITDASGQARWVLQGTWDERVEAAKVIKTVESGKGKIVYETAEAKVMWQRRYPSKELEKCYFFTELAVQLNEIEEGVAPTDSRNRPDQRMMEEGRWDEANEKKVLLEEKQRTVRREREREASDAAANEAEYQGYEPKWFRKDIDPVTGNPAYVYTGEYWDCKEKGDWSRCPDIYL